MCFSIYSFWAVWVFLYLSYVFAASSLFIVLFFFFYVGWFISVWNLLFLWPIESISSNLIKFLFRDTYLLSSPALKFLLIFSYRYISRLASSKSLFRFPNFSTVEFRFVLLYFFYSNIYCYSNKFLLFFIWFSDLWISSAF